MFHSSKQDTIPRKKNAEWDAKRDTWSYTVPNSSQGLPVCFLFSVHLLVLNPINIQRKSLGSPIIYNSNPNQGGETPSMGYQNECHNAPDRTKGLSLDSFLRKYTSEDNAAFEVIAEKNQKARVRIKVGLVVNSVPEVHPDDTVANVEGGYDSEPETK